ncbi:MAG: hypothetical protein ACI8PB_005229 [Desulforhopalus sp.]|jgi:hypothetical protein
MAGSEMSLPFLLESNPRLFQNINGFRLPNQITIKRAISIRLPSSCKPSGEIFIVSSRYSIVKVALFRGHTMQGNIIKYFKTNGIGIVRHTARH